MSTQSIHEISNAWLTLADVEQIVFSETKIALSESAKQKIQSCYTYLHETLDKSDQPIYGINTGFGSLYKFKIETDQLSILQSNLIKSHSCGTGDEVPQDIVRLMLFLKVQSLSYGHSGVQLKTVERLIDFYNKGIYPVVYQQGSLGASGDLAPLAHLSLPLLGEGEVYFQDTRLSGKEINRIWSWEPITLGAKEGLALLNGTQFMNAYGVYNLIKSKNLLNYADLIGALSLEAFDGRKEPFDQLIHHVRNQKGQIKTAENVSKILEGSELIDRPKKHVQDPYSFRCIPQVHGASKDAIQYVETTFENEINAVTDNPNIFPEEDKIISGGNFHGQPLALASDHLTLAISEIASISERRTYQLISGLRELPDFLVSNPGINSGFMIPQYTAASIVSQSKQFCTPASADSIVSSNGQEDHVSMGANAVTKTFIVVHNTEKVLAIELFNASQAIEFRRPAKTSPVLERLISDFRSLVPLVEDDRIMHFDIIEAVKFLQDTSPNKYLN